MLISDLSSDVCSSDLFMRDCTMGIFRTISLASTASLALLAHPAMAGEEAAATDSPTEEGSIIVYGQGETRQVQEVTAKEISVLLPRAEERRVGKEGVRTSRSRW